MVKMAIMIITKVEMMNCQCLFQKDRMVLNGGLRGCRPCSFSSGSIFMWSAMSLWNCLFALSPRHHIDIFLSDFIFMFSNVKREFPGKQTLP